MGLLQFSQPPMGSQHWEKTGLVTVEAADSIPNGWQHWLLWDEVNRDGPHQDQWLQMLRKDAGQNLGFTRLVARKRTDEIPDPYFPFAVAEPQ